MNIFYILVCILPFLFCVEILYLIYMNYNDKFIFYKSLFHIFTIAVLLLYDIINNMYYETIIPVTAITFIIGVNLKEINKKKIRIYNRQNRINLGNINTNTPSMFLYDDAEIYDDIEDFEEFDEL